MKFLKVIAILAISMIAVGCASNQAKDDTRKVVIQVSSADMKTQTIALNNANNVLKALGPGNVEVEIVAYGPGLSMLTKKSKLSKRVASMSTNQDLAFSACGNTMKKIAKKTGKKPGLTKGVNVVPAGVIRIMELQEKGYSYVRP